MKWLKYWNNCNTKLRHWDNTLKKELLQQARDIVESYNPYVGKKDTTGFQGFIAITINPEPKSKTDWACDILKAMRSCENVIWDYKSKIVINDVNLQDDLLIIKYSVVGKLIYSTTPITEAEAAALGIDVSKVVTEINNRKNNEN